jgi:hypothetical protein
MIGNTTHHNNEPHPFQISLFDILAPNDFGYPVYAVWYSCSQRFEDYFDFQSFDYKFT